MKKTILFILLTGFIATINSCDYDDSNDIDIIKPVDSTATGISNQDIPK